MKTFREFATREQAEEYANTQLRSRGFKATVEYERAIYLAGEGVMPACWAVYWTKAVAEQLVA